MFFGKEQKRTMNASDCLAEECALQCAILSPTFKGPAPSAQNGALKNHQLTIVFSKENPIPSAPTKINTYTIGPFQSAKGERAKLKVKVHLSMYGIVSVDSVTLFEEDDVEVQVVKETAKELPKLKQMKLQLMLLLQLHPKLM
ncbi:hypothetical protein KY290_031060 [Solanum tuberosum]|uniref:Uncharacterized protein n=1 Tax=Solanum tuberosum TaxID=4113 RepID=A0ABQ7U838_SOLTU|nr:hypothetical protein KY290_031060 [Solanum tuberosum]